MKALNGAGAGAGASLQTTVDYTAPDAPKDYGAGRECHKCSRRVSRYTRPHTCHNEAEETGVLLCFSCDRKRVDLDATPSEFVRGSGKAAQRGGHHNQGLRLPGLLQARRNAGRMPIDELAMLAGCSPAHVQKVQSGTKRAGVDLAARIAFVLGVSLETLTGARVRACKEAQDEGRTEVVL